MYMYVYIHIPLSARHIASVLRTEMQRTVARMRLTAATVYIATPTSATFYTCHTVALLTSPPPLSACSIVSIIRTEMQARMAAAKMWTTAATAGTATYSPYTVTPPTICLYVYIYT